MDLTDYKKAFENAQSDLEKLMEEREEIDRKIAKLKQAIVGLAPLAEEQSASFLGGPWLKELAATGLTDLVREVLSTAEKPLSPLDVRERLAQLKPDLQTQANVMASIHTVLKRLVPKEARSGHTKEGEIVYWWIRRFPRSSESSLTQRMDAAKLKAMQERLSKKG